LPQGLSNGGRETHHSPLSRSEVKNAWRYTSTLPIRLHDVIISKLSLNKIPGMLCLLCKILELAVLKTKGMGGAVRIS
jgi:hypothetical protein